MVSHNEMVRGWRERFRNGQGLPKSLRSAKNVLVDLSYCKELGLFVDDLIEAVEDLTLLLVEKEKEEEMKKKAREEHTKKEEDKMKRAIAEVKAKKEEDKMKRKMTEEAKNSENLIDHCTFLQNLLQNLQNVARTEEDGKVCETCCKDLEALVQANLSGKWFVQPFGSAVNGFGTRNSDIDVTIYEVDQESDAQSVLEELLKAFQNSGHWVTGTRFSVIEAILSARVPILKLAYHDDCSGRQEVDLSVNNRAPLLNTRLLFNYSSMNERVRQLVVLVKLWAKKQNICGASARFLSSYALHLMAIYFLQVKVGLPCLALQVNPQQTTINWESTRSVASLFIEFFDFYAREFEWDDEVVSIRIGRRESAHGAEFQALDKQMRRLLIEDPYITTRNLGDVLTSQTKVAFHHAIKNMARACEFYQYCRTERIASVGESSSAGLTKAALVSSSHDAKEPSPANPHNPQPTRKKLVNKKLDEPRVARCISDAQEEEEFREERIFENQVLEIQVPEKCDFTIEFSPALDSATPQAQQELLNLRRNVKDAQDKYFLKTPKCSMTGSVYDMYENLEPSNGIPLPANLPVNWRPPPGLEPIMPGLLSMIKVDHGF